MGAPLTYPGVYLEEVSSGQHTITGVATSIAVFIGWSNKGPVDGVVAGDGAGAAMHPLN